MYYPDRDGPVQPLIDTDWGSYSQPLQPYNPDSYITRNFPVPARVRGSNPESGPRPGGIGARYMGADLVGVDDKWKLFLLLGIIGLVAYFIGKNSSKTRRNPSRCSCGHRYRRRRRVGAAVKRLSRIAKQRPRDDLGRFLPE